MGKMVFLILSVVLFLLNSCIRNKLAPCPPLQVNIFVKDKNYSNIDTFTSAEYKSEELAFRDYVPTLCYTLRDATTGKVMEHQDNFKIKNNSGTIPVTFCDCLPFGEYILTVWGGLTDNTTIDSESLLFELHSGNQEGTDSYLINDTLLYDDHNYAYTVALQRTKGKLIIQVENLPDEVNYSEKRIDGLFHYTDPEFNYSGLTSVQTKTSWEKGAAIVSSSTLLAPSSEKETAVISVHLYNRSAIGNPLLTPTAINTTIKRNQLTLLKYVYNNENQNFTIYERLSGSWDIIYDMGIN